MPGRPKSDPRESTEVMEELKDSCMDVGLFGGQLASDALLSSGKLSRKEAVEES